MNRKILGKKIQRTKLRAGDLVLFRAGFYRAPCRHLFRQRSRSRLHQQWCHDFKLTDNYWDKRYREARRVLTSG